MSSLNRNDRVKLYITQQLDKAETKSEKDFTNLPNYDEVSEILDDLIKTKVMGFRGIVATALTGLFLNPNYDPLNNFYACNPRSIFENGIFFAFQNRVPCGKSDPLNVAKNQNELDTNWAKGKRPESAALAVVKFLTLIANNPNQKNILTDFYFYRLIDFSNSIRLVRTILPASHKIPQQVTAHRLVEFVYDYPESGTTPQLLVSLLLKRLYQHSSLVIVGGEESVFGTNTTSKKPADIWIEEKGKPINLYEITVKKIDIKRLDDSFSSLDAMHMLDANIHFICRLPQDVSALKDLTDNTYIYNGKSFNFIDLRSFILTSVALLTPVQLDCLMLDLVKFIADIQRPMKTKEGWNNIFERT